MKSIWVVVVLVAFTLSSCGGQLTKGQAGAGIGAAGGAVIGQAIGHSTEATLIGLAVGTMLGYIVGNEMDKFDRQQLNQVYESAPSGQASSWQNPDSGNQYVVSPQPAVRSAKGPCLRAEIQAIIDGQPQTTYSTACRDDNGQWVLQ